MLSDLPLTTAGAGNIDQFGNQLDEIVFTNTRQHFLNVVTLLLFHKKNSFDLFKFEWKSSLCSTTQSYQRGSLLSRLLRTTLATRFKIGNHQERENFLRSPLTLCAKLFSQAEVENVFFFHVTVRFGKALCVFNDTFHKIRWNYAAVR